jgi:hypothetical protein
MDVAAVNYLSIPDLLKATPAEEGGERFVYIEPSKEARDIQGEVVLAKALADGAPYYKEFGNLDIQHRSILGLAANDPEYHLHEIGHPVEVKVEKGRTFVKGAIYQGDGRQAQCANDYWDSVTNTRPPQRWYPSVGGKVLDADPIIDADGRKTRIVKKIRWSNIGFSRTPVNTAVPQVSRVPFGALAKCLDADGSFDLMKAIDAGNAVAGSAGLTAGYGTDVADLSGGGALRTQSLDHHLQSYWDFRDRLADDLRTNRVPQSSSRMVEHAAAHYGLGKARAAEWVERFMTDLKAGLHQHKGKTQ